LLALRFCLKSKQTTGVCRFFFIWKKWGFDTLIKLLGSSREKKKHYGLCYFLGESWCVPNFDYSLIIEGLFLLLLAKRRKGGTN